MLKASHAYVSGVREVFISQAVKLKEETGSKNIQERAFSQV
ncbi:MAG: hypothetical protein ACPL4E_10155 [Thermoproteota archaeon]